jgi:citrate lyase subunit beta/citryl-CoA lyase
MAGKIVAAFKAAQAEGKGVVTVDGRMIENLHVEQAERALALAAAIKELQEAA